MCSKPRLGSVLLLLPSHARKSSRAVSLFLRLFSPGVGSSPPKSLDLLKEPRKTTLKRIFIHRGNHYKFTYFAWNQLLILLVHRNDGGHIEPQRDIDWKARELPRMR